MCGGIVLLPRWFKKVGPGTLREVPESDVPQSYIDRDAEATALREKLARENAHLEGVRDAYEARMRQVDEAIEAEAAVAPSGGFGGKSAAVRASSSACAIHTRSSRIAARSRAWRTEFA